MEVNLAQKMFPEVEGPVYKPESHPAAQLL